MSIESTYRQVFIDGMFGSTEEFLINRGEEAHLRQLFILQPRSSYLQ